VTETLDTKRTVTELRRKKRSFAGDISTWYRVRIPTGPFEKYLIEVKLK